jgi:hypothetical protein
MKRYYLVVAMLVLPSVSYANCDSILNVARTYYSQYSKEDLRSFAYSKLCSSTSTSNNSENGLNAAIDDLGLGITSKSSRSEVQAWCGQNSNLFSGTSVAQQISVQVDKPTIDAWSSCKAAEQDKLKVEVTAATNGQSLQIKLKNDNVSNAGILSFTSQSDGNMDCNLITAQDQNGSRIIGSGQYAYVNCDILKDTSSPHLLPSGSVTLNTTVGGFLYSVPRLDLTPPSPPHKCHLVPPDKFIVNLKGKIHKSIAYWGAGGGNIKRGPRSTGFKYCDLGISSNMQTFIISEKEDWLRNHRSITCNDGQGGLCDSAGESCSDYSITRGCAINKDYIDWMTECSARAQVSYDPKNECP